VAWFFLRPKMLGVKGIVRDGDQVLLVRHTYGDRRRWDVPGGHAHKGEPPEDAVRREMCEELGIEPAWRKIGALGARTDRKVEDVHCFVAERPAGEIVLAPGEITEGRWFSLDALPDRMSELSLRSLALLPRQR
jgi:8-oxo-dGTP pyrophosphatase MutT (NUDIX family)